MTINKRNITFKPISSIQYNRKSFLITSLIITLGTTYYIVSQKNFNNKTNQLLYQLEQLPIIKSIESGELGSYQLQKDYLQPSEGEDTMATTTSLTQSSYRGNSKLPFSTKVYINPLLKCSVEVGYIGNELSDGKGYVHEGVLSALLDEAFARLAYEKFGIHQLFTANLKINYLNKLETDNFFIIECSLNNDKEDKSYKANMKAVVRKVDSEEVIANAEALFLVPKQFRELIKKDY